VIPACPFPCAIAPTAASMQAAVNKILFCLICL
jgi:hypothetical protein